MSHPCTKWLPETATGGENVTPWSTERETKILFWPLLTNRDQHTYTFPSLAPPVRSTSSIGLSLNCPRKFRDGVPWPTITVRW